jgi:dihydrofolate reductase
MPAVGTGMSDSNKIIVIQFVTLDGVVEDPDGSGGTPRSGWCYRFGLEAIGGDKFHLGPILDTGAVLFGRKTWTVFSQRWPARTDDFATTMNRATKYVASRTLDSIDRWSNSHLLDGELIPAVEKLRAARDVVVIGSTSVVHQLAVAGVVDEYRLLVFPTVVGAGERLFAKGVPVDLELASADTAGPLVLLRYTVERTDHS